VQHFPQQGCNNPQHFDWKVILTTDGQVDADELAVKAEIWKVESKP
jgi:hypothetical protein